MTFERISDKKRLDFIIKAIQKTVPSNGTILDVGCGNGIISHAIGSLGFSVYGIDSSEKAILEARQGMGLSNIQFRVMDAGQLASDGNRYDAIICSEVLEHLGNPEALLRTLFRCLNDPGILVVTVPNGKGPREILVTRPLQNLEMKNNRLWKSIKKIKSVLGYTGTTLQSSATDLTHLQFFTKKALERLAADTHFRIVEFGKTNFIEQVFPFSILTRYSPFLQKIDCALADRLPYRFSSGFLTIWQKKMEN